MLYWEYQTYIKELEEVYKEINKQKERQQKLQEQQNKRSNSASSVNKYARAPRHRPPSGKRR